MSRAGLAEAPEPMTKSAVGFVTTPVGRKVAPPVPVGKRMTKGDPAGCNNAAPAPSPKMMHTARSVKSVIEEFTSDPMTRTFLYCPDSTNFAPVFSA